MGHYRSNLRDLRFNLFEVLGLDELLGTGRFAELDAETVERHAGRGGAALVRAAGRVVHRGRP